ncbi:MAG: hypothetical protein ABJA35_14365 [Parafilimonas sp.]
MKIVHICGANQGNNEALKKDIEVLNRAYPDINIEFIEIDGLFGLILLMTFQKNGTFQKTLCL